MKRVADNPDDCFKIDVGQLKEMSYDKRWKDYLGENQQDKLKGRNSNEFTVTRFTVGDPGQMNQLVLNSLILNEHQKTSKHFIEYAVHGLT